jgi:hypothetical protein
MSTPPLDELDADALAMLDAFRAEEQIPKRVHDRVWRRVQADVAAPPVRWSARGVVLGGLAVAAAVALMWVGRQALAPVETQPPASQAGYERAGAGPEGVAEPRERERSGPRGGDPRGATAAEGTTEPEAEPAPPIEPEHAVPRDPIIDPTAGPRSPSTPSRPKTDRRGAADRPATSAEPTPKPEPTPALGSTLAEENRLIARARAALLDEHPEQALQHLDEHARRFEAGVLGQERQALRAVALCEAGRELEGSAAARSFLRAHPRAALAQRVRSACLEP